MEKEAVTVKGIRKIYKLYDRPADRFKEAFSFTKKQYHKDHYALDGIDFTVKSGECLGIIGTNGSGKSTLLKIITGVLSPTDGEVKIHGRVSALLELGAGYNMEYTGLENVYLNGTMMGLSRKEMDQRLPFIEAFAEIGEFIHQPVKSYSSGMFARLAFSAAIHVDPDILIVDEALSVGDIFFQAKCYRKFNEFKSQGKTIIFVSHDMGSIIKYCERCLLIHKGKQAALGKSLDVVNTYKKILARPCEEEDDGADTPDEADTEVWMEGRNEKEALWKESLIRNPNFVEYGDGRAEITDFAIINENGVCTPVIHKGTEFTIRIKVRFNAPLPEPVIAYTIKDLKGTEITGTNTALENRPVGAAEPGDVVTVSFRQKMALQGAQYLVAFGCTGYEDDRLVVYHRLYDMVNLQVISDRNTIGYVDMNAQVCITKER